MINNAIWLRADLERVLREWSALGADGRRAPSRRQQGARGALHVEPMPKGSPTGARRCSTTAAGDRDPGRLLHHNRHTCIGCGWCNYGCRYDRKTSMLVTYIPWAQARGAKLQDGCREAEVNLVRAPWRRGVRFDRDGREQVVEADRVVVSAGAIGSSEVLLHSGIDQDGRVGSACTRSPVRFVTAETEKQVDGFDGIGLCASPTPAARS